MASLVARSPAGRRLLAPLVIFALIQLTLCQVSEDDAQFEAVHQDIGRISGLQSGSQVAAPTTFVHRQPQARQQELPQQQPAYEQPAQVAAPPARARVQPVLKKAARITLVPRRDQYTPLGDETAAQPQAPPTQPQAASALVPAQLPAPTFDAIAPATIQPLQLQQQQPAFHQPAHVGLAPVATNQQRAANTISARHSALIAQVAAERAAVGGLDTPPPVAALAVANEALASTQSQAHPARPVHQQPHQQLHHHQSLQPTHHAAASTAPLFQQHQAQPASLGQPQAASAGIAPAFVLDSAQEALQPAPSFEQVLNGGCPPKGVFSYENRDFCDRYYMCTNGTFTEEACPNGLAYSQQGAVYQHCAYNWNVDCGRKKGPEPISSPGCPWQFGIFPIAANGQCSIDYFVCEWGVPETKRCSPEGLFYDERIKGCQWADQLGCKSEALLNFKCPAEDEENPYWPYPRYYHNQQDVIVCVNEQPRLVHCNEDQLVDPASLACVDVRKKKKF